MGYYIEVPNDFHKAEQIVRLYGGKTIPQPHSFAEVPAGKALIVIVDNVAFEAAGLAYSEPEFKAFTQPSDHRRKQFVLMDWEKACELTGFDGGDYR